MPPIRDVVRSWDGASLFLPVDDPDYRIVVLDGPIHAPYMRRARERTDPRTLRGIIIHLHGCSYSRRDMTVRGQARFMASLGYAVIVPNSFRRLYRPQTCDPERRMGLPRARYLEVHRMRQEELAYAIARARAIPGWQSHAVYASGYSEGADAVVAFEHPQLRGRIAIGASCWLGGKPDDDAPILVITSTDDVWYGETTWPAARGLCRRTLAGEPSVELLEPRGAMHDALIYGEARTALWNFLVRIAY